MPRSKNIDIVEEQAGIISDIIYLAHILNMKTDHKISMPVDIPEKTYKQFDIGIDKNSNAFWDTTVIFLETEDATQQLKDLRQKLADMIREELPEYKFGRVYRGRK